MITDEVLIRVRSFYLIVVPFGTWKRKYPWWTWLVVGGLTTPIPFLAYSMLKGKKEKVKA